MSQPVVSVIVATKKPELWPDFCQNFSSNKIPFEIIFVGPNSPTFKLPENVIFIKTNVKPTQCVEVAFRQSEGEFIFQVVDDFVFTDGVIDILYENFLKANNDKNVFSPRHQKSSGTLKPDSRCLMAPKQLNSPLIALCGGFIKKETWNELGGLDSHFITSLSVRDLFLRGYGIGGKLIYCDNISGYELPKGKKQKKLNPIKRLWSLTDKYDQPEFLKAWVRKIKSGEECPSESIWCYYNKSKKLILSKKRLRSVIPFSDKNLLTVSQGRNIKKIWD
jgi:hypothetical protein